MFIIFRYLHYLCILLVFLQFSYSSYAFTLPKPVWLGSLSYRITTHAAVDSDGFFKNALDDSDDEDSQSFRSFFSQSRPKVPRKKIVDNLSTYRVQDLNPPYEPGHTRYNALIHLLGIPFDTKEYMIANWLQDYHVGVDDVIFLYEFKGAFHGDAYVRCINTGMKNRIVKEKHMNHFSGRYIEIYPISESAYRQYYRAKYYKKVRGGFYTPLDVLVPYYEDYKANRKKLGELELGDLILGRISKITEKGAIIEPLNVDSDGCNSVMLLCNNRLSQNVTFYGNVYGDVQVRLIPGMDLNLFYEKTRIVEGNFDFWDEKTVILNSKGERSNPLRIVYVTMDCTINDYKVELIEKAILKSKN